MPLLRRKKKKMYGTIQYIPLLVNPHTHAYDGDSEPEPKPEPESEPDPEAAAAAAAASSSWYILSAYIWIFSSTSGARVKSDIYPNVRNNFYSSLISTTFPFHEKKKRKRRKKHTACVI